MMTTYQAEENVQIVIAMLKMRTKDELLKDFIRADNEGLSMLSSLILDEIFNLIILEEQKASNERP